MISWISLVDRVDQQSIGDPRFFSSIPQIIQTNDVVCTPLGMTSIQAIVLRFPPEIVLQPRLKSLDGSPDIEFQSRAYLYVQLFPSSYFASPKCFQVDLGSSNTTGYMQLIFKNASNNSQKSINSAASNDLCTTRRIKCRNGGQCQVLSDGQTKCLCPDHTSGSNCENGRLHFLQKDSSNSFVLVGIRCGNIVCINGAVCSLDRQSCICPLGTQGRDCSTRCGESYTQPNISSDRIINGQAAVKNSWPFVVYVQIGDFGWCGGSLIDAWTVLTAAHCTYNRDLDEFNLWFGVHKLEERETEMKMGIVETRTVSEIINHPKYKVYPIKDFQNDLALLRLAQPVDETAYIRYLCIPPKDHPMTDLNFNHRLNIIGWGYINKLLSDGKLIRRTTELQQATIGILPDLNCMEYEKDDIPLFQSALMICAGTHDYKTDSCQGDSGGPLLMEYNNRW